jgi:8-oxo-(d)GTP phosphatase
MAATIQAAGTVLLRRTKSDGVRVCVIHRPRHKDWSLPKGKRHNGELLSVTAWRETREETNLDIMLGVPLPQQRYQVDGRPKTVDYWVSSVPGQLRKFKPNNEVDQLLWLSPAKARAKLTYPRDIELMDHALEIPPTSPLVVLRHTTALKRGDYKGNRDAKRPLSMDGRVEAKALVPQLQAFGITNVHSSSSRRCVETVLPLARRIGVEVVSEPLFSEESFENQPRITLARLSRLARRRTPAVLCTHRPVLPEVIAALAEQFKLKPKSPELDPVLPPGGYIVFHREVRPDGRIGRNCVAIERYLS